MTNPLTSLIFIVSMLAITTRGAIRSWDNFRLPTLEEFWVVPLQQAAIIENHAASHSQHHDALEVNGVTAVLPFSFSRLNVLPILCAVWHGPVSAALYVPVMDGSVHLAQHSLHGASLDEVRQHVHEIVTGLPGRCSMRVILAVEELPTDETLLADGLFSIPVNALRNIALLNAATEAVLLLDGDFIPGPATLHDDLQHHMLPSLRSEMQQHGTMLVVPALMCDQPWEQGPDGLPTFPNSEHDTDIRRMFMQANASIDKATGKAAAVAALEGGKIKLFQAPHHSNTNYTQWATADEPYGVLGKATYEPYVVALKSSLPRWDERFRGYVRVCVFTVRKSLQATRAQYFNKISYMSGLSIQDGRPYKVLPNAFALHLRHAKPVTTPPSKNPMYLKVRTDGAGPRNVTHHVKQWRAIYYSDVRPSIINKTYVTVAVEHGQLSEL